MSSAAGRVAGRVAVVTDSTACLPAELAARWGVTVVPLQVVIDGVAAEEAGAGGAGGGGGGSRPDAGSGPAAGSGTPAAPGAVTDALHRRLPVTTSRPAPAALRATYEELARVGAAQVVSVHLSQQLSGTVEAARLAAGGTSVPVHVVDSRSLCMGLGFAVLSAAAAAAAGADGPAVAEAASRRAAATTTYFYVDTLEHLRRGGRLGAASALLGTALAVKPLLHVVDGRIELLDKVRTTSRALARLEDLAVQAAGPGGSAATGDSGGTAGADGVAPRDEAASGVEVAVHHLAAAERAAGVATRLRARIPGLAPVPVTEVGAVVGAHAGPGLLGVVIAPR